MYRRRRYADTRGKSLTGGYTTIPEAPDPVAENGVMLEVLGEDSEKHKLDAFYSMVDTTPYEPLAPSQLAALGAGRRADLLEARAREESRIVGDAQELPPPAERARSVGEERRSSSPELASRQFQGRSASVDRAFPHVVLSKDGSLIVPTEQLVKIDGNYSWRERALSYIRAMHPTLSLHTQSSAQPGPASPRPPEFSEGNGVETWLTGESAGTEASRSSSRGSTRKRRLGRSASVAGLLLGPKRTLHSPRQQGQPRKGGGLFSGDLGNVDNESLLQAPDIDSLQGYLQSPPRASSRAASRLTGASLISLDLPELTGSSDLSEIHEEVLELRQGVHDLLALTSPAKAESKAEPSAGESGQDSSEAATLLPSGKKRARGGRRRFAGAARAVQTAGTAETEFLSRSREAAPAPTGKASVVSTLLNALNTNVGCGSLTIPYDLALMGWLPGVIFTLLMTATSILAGLLLVIASDYTGRFQYGEVVKRVFNSNKLKILLNLLLIVYLAGCCMSNSIITKHNFFWWSCAPDDEACIANTALGKPVWWYSNALLWGLMFVVCLPFCCLPNLELLKFNAYVTVVSYLYLVVSCVVLFFDARGRPELLPEHGPPILLNRDPFSFISAFPLLSQAFTMHYQILNLYREIRGRTAQKMKVGIYGDILLMLVSYLIMGLFSYFTLTDTLTSDITADLARVSPQPVYLTVESVLILLLMIVHYPLPVFALRRAVESFMWGEKQPPLKWSCCIAAAVVFLATLVGTFVDSVSSVISFTSSIAGTSLVYLFPAAMCLTISKQVHSRRLRWISLGILVYGATLMVLGLFSAVYKEIYLPIARAVGPSESSQVSIWGRSRLLFPLTRRR